ncbi:MAG: epoxyqueuosine reductase [Ruminococcaceae bacterium]|nr:epoxyqueuosine reductase [Oscillospiraceae bacterium]
MHIEEQIKQILEENGIGVWGFTCLHDGPSGLPYALSIVVPLSPAILDEIESAPTHTYYHHYRTVNAHIDRVLLQVGLLLQKQGWRYIPVAASQSIPDQGERSHYGLYSHKKVAASAGLGTLGKSTLFLHQNYGARVRLGSLFTDCPLPVRQVIPESVCAGCDLCVKACPAGAIKGTVWQKDASREDLLDAQACNQYMRSHFMQIGRGAGCGICVKVCPYAQIALNSRSRRS